MEDKGEFSIKNEIHAYVRACIRLTPGRDYQCHAVTRPLAARAASTRMARPILAITKASRTGMACIQLSAATE